MKIRRSVLRAASVIAAATIAFAVFASLGGSVSAGPPPMMSKTGDLNMDGRVNSLDALQVLVYDAGMMKKPSAGQAIFLAGDVNCDESLNALDASLILQATAGLYNLRA